MLTVISILQNLRQAMDVRKLDSGRTTVLR